MIIQILDTINDDIKQIRTDVFIKEQAPVVFFRGRNREKRMWDEWRCVKSIEANIWARKL